MNRNLFWDRPHDSDFVMLSASHLIALSVIALCCLALFGARFALRSRSGLRLGTRLLLILLLAASEGACMSGISPMAAGAAAPPCRWNYAELPCFCRS